MKRAITSRLGADNTEYMETSSLDIICVLGAFRLQLYQVERKEEKMQKCSCLLFLFIALTVDSKSETEH